MTSDDRSNSSVVAEPSHNPEVRDEHCGHVVKAHQQAASRIEQKVGRGNSKNDMPNRIWEPCKL